MRMSDMIVEWIQQMLEETGSADIRRNELAGQLGCVPSQINYVLHSRFKPEYGYIVESRRGGGGYIRITRINPDGRTELMHIVNSIGDTIDAQSTRVILTHLLDAGRIDRRQYMLMSAALADQAYTDVEASRREGLRASILKHMLLTLI